MYDQSVSSTTSSPPGHRNSDLHLLRIGQGSGGLGQPGHHQGGGAGAGGVIQAQHHPHHPQQPQQQQQHPPPPEYSWNNLPVPQQQQQQQDPSGYPSVPGATMLQQSPALLSPPHHPTPPAGPPGQTHLQLSLPGPLPSLQSPSAAGQGSFWGPLGGGVGAADSQGDQHRQSPSTSTTSSRGGNGGGSEYSQILHPDEINSDDELDSSFHSGPSSTTPDNPSGSPPKKKKGIACSIWFHN